MGVVRWLHLSDIHFYHAGSETNRIREYLCNYFKNTSFEIKYLIITGDLRFAKKEKQFSQDLARFINTIRELLRIPTKNFFFVPGNHDIVRSKTRILTVKSILYGDSETNTKKYNSKEGNICEEDLKTLHDNKKLLLKFLEEHLFKGCQERLQFYDNPLKPHFVIKSDDLNVFHVDTSLICHKKEGEHGNLILGTYYLSEALKECDTSKPTIAIAHHPLEALTFEESCQVIKILKDNNVSLWNCGHVHTTYIKPTDDLTQALIGNLHFDTENSSQPSFIIGEIDLNLLKGNLLCYRWDGNGWRPDVVEKSDSTIIKDSRNFLLKSSSFSITNANLSKPINYDSLKNFKDFYNRILGNNGSFYLLNINEKIIPSLKAEDFLKTNYINENGMSLPLQDCLEDIWKQEIRKHILIVGDGGTGKTVSLLKTWEILLDEEICSVYIPLHELKNNSDNVIEHYIKDHVFYNDNNETELFFSNIKKNSSKTKKPEFVILLDGFNEISHNMYSKISTSIKNLMQFVNIQLVLTSRFDFRAIFGLGNISKIVVEPLDNNQVKNYLMLYNIKIPEEDLLFKLIKTPLLLTLYTYTSAEIKRHGNLEYLLWEKKLKTPGSILWNYMQCQVAKPLDQKDFSYNIFLLRVITVEYILPFIAWKMESSEQFAIDENTVLEWLVEIIDYYNKKPEKMLPNRIQKIIRDFLLKKPLLEFKICWSMLVKEMHLMIVNNGNYSFIHQDFRDFLSANHLINLINKLYVEQNKYSAWSSKALSQNVIRFISEFDNGILASNSSLVLNFWDSLRNKEWNDGDYRWNNAINVLKVSLNNNFSKIDFSNQDLRGVNLNGIFNRK